MPRVVVVLPAYNAEKTLEATVRDIPTGWADEIILVDDVSKDGTAALAKQLGLRVIQHERNKGYGGNQKTCYQEALKAGADIVVMVHPDYQYDARLIPYLVELVKEGVCDVVLGNRIRTRWEAIRGGMPLPRYLINRLSTIFENLLLGQNLGEWHSGLRAYSREVLQTIPWEQNSDDFSFDQQFLIQAVYFHFRIGDIPCPARYFAEASSIRPRKIIRYGVGALWTIFRYFLHKWGIWPCNLFIKK